MSENLFRVVSTSAPFFLAPAPHDHPSPVSRPLLTEGGGPGKGTSDLLERGQTEEKKS